MWGLCIGSIMLLAVSVSMSSCDVKSSPSGHAAIEPGSSMFTVIGSSYAASKMMAGNGSMLTSHNASTR